MNTLSILFLSLLYVLSQAATVAADSSLFKIARADEKDAIQLYLSLSAIPRHSAKIIGKKVEVTLEATRLAPELELFEADEKIIKIVPTNKKGTESLSFYFRHPPEDVSIEPSQDGKLVVTIALLNKQNKSIREISEKLKEVAVVEEKNLEYANPLAVSPYAADWNSFFANFETKVKITAPMQFISTPFPIIAILPPNLEKNLSLLPHEIQDAAQQNLYDVLLPLLLDALHSEHDLEKQKLLALSYGEALMRSKDFEGAYKQLYLLAEKYSSEQVGIFARYLLSRLQADYQDPTLAEAELRELESQILPKSPLAPYFRLLQIETALAAQKYARVQELLAKKDVGLPDNLIQLQELHRAEYLAATGNTVQAYVILNQQKNSEIFSTQPSALNSYCSILYSNHKYQDAYTCYEKMEGSITESQTLGMVSYRKNMAQLHIKAASSMVDIFAHIEDSFPESEAGLRGALKHTDLRYLENHDFAETAAQKYHEIAETELNREITAEAIFKEALIRSLLKQNSQSLEILSRFLRDFQLSELRNSALALMIQLVPTEIRRLIAENNPMAALVLAKQNRLLFERQWVDVHIFADIAAAYQKVGIFSEAKRVYQHLMSVVGEKEKHLYFLPLIDAAYQQAEYNLVDDYASVYLQKYPSGQDATAILLLHLKALEAMGKTDKALEILPKELPANQELHLLVASLYFDKNKYSQAKTVLTENMPTPEKLPAEAQQILAESLFQLKEYQAAADLFALLAQQEKYREQATFRLAQHARQQGNEENALKLFQQLVEKGNDSTWKKYAEKEIEYAKLLKTTKKSR